MEKTEMMEHLSPACASSRIRELEAELGQAQARIAELEADAAPSSGTGSRIIEGLRQALQGDFARVTIEGKTWVRHDAGSRPYVASAPTTGRAPALGYKDVDK